MIKSGLCSVPSGGTELDFYTELINSSESQPHFIHLQNRGGNTIWVGGSGNVSDTGGQVVLDGDDFHAEIRGGDRLVAVAGGAGVDIRALIITR